MVCLYDFETGCDEINDSHFLESELRMVRFPSRKGTILRIYQQC